MSDSKSLIRQWRLLRFLAAARNGFTVKELTDEMEVSMKTVRRDLEDLALAGFRVRERVGFRGVNRLTVSGGDEKIIEKPENLAARKVRRSKPA